MRVVIQREEALDGLGAAGAGLEKGLDGLAQLREAAVGMMAGVLGGAVVPVEGRGDLEDLAPGLQEVAVEHRGGVASVQHGAPSPGGSSSIVSITPIIPYRRPQRNFSTGG